ncbi:MAG: hypothetical protein HKN30_02145 [Sulfitobacter sp.]|nr:hypothetical protein [Sulfitobacter sp.]
MYKRILTAGLLFGMVSTGPPAHAAGCALRDAMVEKLTETYAERLTATGLQNAQSMVEIWTSDETGTFTILVTRPNGISCLVSAGEHWTPVPVRKSPEGVGG